MKWDLPLLLLTLMCLPSERSCASTVEKPHEKKIHGDSIWDTRSVVDEATRVRVFKERHSTWPDPKWLAAEHPGYSRRMRERTAAVMEHTQSQKRWDEWMFLAQARLMPKFTFRQWDVVDAPREIHEKLRDRFQTMLPHAKLESMGPGLSGVEGPLHATFFEQEELNYEVLHALTPLFSEWAGVELEPTSVYGVRVYRNGSTLRDHLDVLETHVISGILHIDSDLDGPFPIQIEDGTGELASLNLKPGQLMFYESAKCFHQRSIPMRGRYYASIFLHYRPIGWNMTREQPRFAIPPFWADNLSSREDEHGVVEVPNSHAKEQRADSELPNGGMDVTFVNDGPAVIELWWIPASNVLEEWTAAAVDTSAAGEAQPRASKELLATGTPLQAMQPNGDRSTMSTFEGHVFFAIAARAAVDSDESSRIVKAWWTVRSGDTGGELFVTQSNANPKRYSHKPDVKKDEL